MNIYRKKKKTQLKYELHLVFLQVIQRKICDVVY